MLGKINNVGKVNNIGNANNAGKINNATEEGKRAPAWIVAILGATPVIGFGTVIGMISRTGQIADYNFPAGIEKYIDDEKGQTLSRRAAYNYARNTFDEDDDGRISHEEYLRAQSLMRDARPGFFSFNIPVPPGNILRTQRSILEALNKIRNEDDPLGHHDFFREPTPDS